MKRPALALALPAVLLLAACDGSGSSAAPAPTVTVTATETVTAEPMQPEESYSSPVEGEPGGGATSGVAMDKLALGEPFPMTAGVVVTIGAPVLQEVEDVTIGAEKGDTVVRFPVRLENGGDKPVGSSPLTLQVATGDKEADSVYSAEACGAPSVDAIPGRSLEWGACFKVEPGQKMALQWAWTDPESWEQMTGFMEIDPVA